MKVNQTTIDRFPVYQLANLDKYQGYWVIWHRGRQKNIGSEEERIKTNEENEKVQS